MTTISQKSRDDLISMLNTERSGLRCEIMKELHVKAISIKDEFVDELKECRKDINTIENRIDEIKKHRTSILSIEQLLVFDERDKYSSCPVSDLHPSLKEFDAETNKLKKEIILM